MKRLLSLVLGAALICALVLPVTALASEGAPPAWIELLETATVNDQGNNLISIDGQSCRFSVKTPLYMRLTKCDLIITHSANNGPSAVSVSYNGTTYPLTLAKVDSTTTRVYGTNMPDTLYADVVFVVQKTSQGSATYQLLSCKVGTLTASEFPAMAFSDIAGDRYLAPFAMSAQDDEAADIYDQFQFPVFITDWQKFDQIVLSGSVTSMALNGIRCTIGGLGLPFEMTYAVTSPTSYTTESFLWSETKYYTYDETYKGTTEGSLISYAEYNCKVLFTITIDLTGVDRTSTQYLYVWFTGLANDWYGYAIQFLGVTGTINVADVTDVTWWSRFTSFMTDLFGSGKGQESIDDLGQSSDSISQGASDIQAFEQSQQAVLDTGMTTIQNSISYTSFMSALVFVQKYANMTFDGISQYAIVFTLPLFLGLFFYLCSRIPGITRWKPRPPKSKGGDSP